jgi:hypothetical protein
MTLKIGWLHEAKNSRGTWLHEADDWQAALLAEVGLAEEDVKSLVAHPRKAVVDIAPYLSSALGQHPFLRVGTETIVVAPHRLADAAAGLARACISRDGAREQVAEMLHSLACLNVGESLRRLHLDHVAPWAHRRSAASDTLLSVSAFAWDYNRLAHVVIVSDACSRADGAWEPSDVLSLVAENRRNFDAENADAVPRLRDTFTIVVVVPISGAADVALGTRDQDVDGLIVLSGADLEAVALGTDDPDPARLLGRYVRARKDLTSRGCEVHAFSELDVVAAWCDLEHRFMSGPTLLSIGGDHGRSLRDTALEKRDRHSAPGPRGSVVVEVEIAEDPSLPIYGRRGSQLEFPQVVVEVLGRFLWFELRMAEDLAVDDRAWALQCLRMCAYWTAELGLELDVQLPADRPQVVLAEVIAVPVLAPALEPDGYVLEVLPDRVRLEMSPMFTGRYDNANAVERAFAGDLMSALLRAMGENRRDIVDVAVARRAPPGPKRMMHSVNTADVPEYHFSDELPEALHAHDADLHWISRWLVEEAPIDGGDGGLGGVTARAWLNAAVACLFKELRARIARFDAPRLLARLMLNAERLIFELAQEEVTLPSQITCHGRAPDFVARLREGASRRASASAATRFLIELVGAERYVSGDDYPGETDVQFLLALALELITLGAASDVAAYNLGTVSVRDGDGYLVLSRGVYDVAAGTVGSAALAEQMSTEGSRTTVGRLAGPNRARRQQHGDDARWRRLSEGLVAEFGVSFDQFNAFIGSVMAVWQEAGAPLVVMAETVFVDKVAVASGIARDVIAGLVNQFATRRRDDYLAPPSPWRRADTFPWHANRPLSYLQRPFVCDDDGTLRFTGGHLHRAWVFILLLMTTGRFKAHTQPLNDAMSAFTEAAGAVFNDRVASALLSIGLSAAARVKKFGADKIQDEHGNDLGDIDVLAVDENARLLLVVECKNMSPDRLPHQVKSDLDALFLGGPGKPSAQDKHLKRVKWVETNLASVVAARGLLSGPWSIRPLLVLSEPLQASYLGHAKMPVLTIAALERGGAELASVLQVPVGSRD